jgi:cytochrome o ubiquinol oxidase subunit 1
MQHYDVVSWQPWLVAAAIGVVIILAGIVCQVIQLVVSIRNREQLKATADPWNGRTLEWATASPPPTWNFAVLPRVSAIDALWYGKQRAHLQQAQTLSEREFESIEVPKNSATGFITAFFAVVGGFALIWHIWWIAGVGLIGIFLTVLAFAFRSDEEIKIPAEQVARFEQAQQVEIAA